MAVRRYAASVARQCGLLRAAAMRGTCSGDAARYFAWRRRAADGGCDASDRTAGEHCCVCVGAAAHRTAGAPHLPRRPCTGRHGRGHRGGCGWRRVHAHRPAPPVPGASPAATTCESAALHMPGILFRGMPTHTVPVCARSTRYITNAHSLEQSPPPRSWPTPRRCRVCPPPPCRGGCRWWRRRMPWRRRARGTDRASCSCSALLQQAMPASSLAEAQGGVQGAGEGVGGQGAGQIREGAKRLSTLASLCDHAGPSCMFRSTWSSSDLSTRVLDPISNDRLPLVVQRPRVAVHVHRLLQLLQDGLLPLVHPGASGGRGLQPEPGFESKSVDGGRHPRAPGLPRQAPAARPHAPGTASPGPTPPACRSFSGKRAHGAHVTPRVLAPQHTPWPPHLERLLELAARLLKLGGGERQPRVLVLAVLRQALRVGAHLLQKWPPQHTAQVSAVTLCALLRSRSECSMSSRAAAAWRARQRQGWT